jgi:nucleoside-diphosphate-sugar epimerase
MTELRSALVVGSTGFVGQALTRRLMDENVATHSLVFLDRPRRTTPPCELIECEGNSAAAIARALDRRTFDAVFHLAAAGVMPERRQPQQLLAGNAALVTDVLEAVRNAPPGIFVYSGSCAEYSSAHAPNRITEDHPTCPVDLYGAAKASTTIWASALARNLEIPFVTLRLFHIFGPGEAPSRLIPYLADCLHDGVAARLTGGEQVRDFLYIDDVVSAFLAAARTQLEPYSVYNVCSAEPVSVRSAAEMLASTMGAPLDSLQFGALPYRPNEEMWIVGDNRRFVERTGWSRSVTLQHGFARFIEARYGRTVSHAGK